MTQVCMGLNTGVMLRDPDDEFEPDVPPTPPSLGQGVHVHYRETREGERRVCITEDGLPGIFRGAGGKYLDAQARAVALWRAAKRLARAQALMDQDYRTAARSRGEAEEALPARPLSHYVDLLDLAPEDEEN